MLKNVQEAKFRSVLLPIARKVLADRPVGLDPIHDGTLDGLVVFDAASGVRLWDSAAGGTGEKAAKEITDGVETAARKRALSS